MLETDIARWCDASELTTFKGGGRALVYFPRNRDEFAKTLFRLQSDGISPYILGGGSNALIADGALQTPVICTKNMRGLAFEGREAIFEAGVSVARLMSEARARGLGGLEFLEGVPATLGGALKMNAGAFGACMADIAVYAEVLRAEGDMLILRETPNFGYRRGAQGIVLGGALRLERMTAEESLARREKFLTARRQKQPRQPSCGSVFKNVIMSADECERLGLLQFAQNADMRADERVIFIGKLLDACGLRGERAGGAQISEKHANFIINAGGATAADFLSLANLMRRRAAENFGVSPEREFVLFT